MGERTPMGKVRLVLIRFIIITSPKFADQVYQTQVNNWNQVQNHQTLRKHEWEMLKLQGMVEDVSKRDNDSSRVHITLY